MEFHTQILTAKGYSWQKLDKRPALINDLLPVCRAIHLDLFIPGTLVGNKCRIGFGSKVYSHNDFEVLKPI